MKVMIAMSGGVDSSAAALLMKKQGYDCCGVMLRLREDPALDQDIADAAAVCSALDLPFEVLDLRDAFRDQVIAPFIRTYEAGGTPNPCIDCNRTMKFGRLLEYALSSGADALVTGHYARIEQDLSGRYHLKKGLDTARDQSYVLYGLNPFALSHVLLPLGTRTKDEIRSLAAEASLPTHHKKDSQDICFVPDGDYAGFIEKTTGKAPLPGPFLLSDGTKLGTHRGLIHYTIGQRKGLGISSASPLYVTQLCPENNSVILSHGEGLYSASVLAGCVSFTNGEPPKEALRVRARIRYAQKEQPASAFMENGLLRVVFDDPQRAVTPGQSLVLYREDEVLGGGIILKS